MVIRMRGGVFSETLDRDYLNGLSEKDRTSVVEHLFVLMESRSKGCPFCSSSRVIRKGYSSSGTQRYACKSCGKGFIGNVVPNSHIRIDTWKEFCRSYLKGSSIHRCASECEVCLKTAHYMKCRLVDMFRDNPLIPMVFSGEVLLDLGSGLPAIPGQDMVNLRNRS